MIGNDEDARPLTELRLPKRALNALLRGGISTVEEAAEWSDRDLLSLPHFGRASVASLRALTGRIADEGRAGP
jgi:DNA-directed RNA polymerase alpha subunit